MKKRTFLVFFSILLSVFCLGGFVACPPAAANYDPLVSWNEGTTKETIVNFVEEVTNPNSCNYVPPSGRIVTIDNDGTLWTEKPIVIQGEFLKYRLGNAFPDVTLASLTEKDIVLADLQLPEMTPEEYKDEARKFLDKKNHPYLGVPYIQLTFQPMVELVNYLQSNDFKVYICSGGGTDFIRSFAEDAYGIPPENIIGSTTQTQYCCTEDHGTYSCPEYEDDGTYSCPEYENDETYVLVKKRELVKPFNDGPGKVVGIDRYIGKKPIMAVGNSSGDLAMLDYTDDDQGPALMMLLHHDDTRECPDGYPVTIGGHDIYCPYDTRPGDDTNPFDVANERGWTVISMEEDFVTVYGEEIDQAQTGSELDISNEDFVTVSGEEIDQAQTGSELDISNQDFWDRIIQEVTRIRK
ncbi:HAD family hydrolase [Moorena sp. SIO3B2]|uniref:HAD family hydrolase n=1 Tax=Moorena sp. SIO3B2 TaxID=2607827 RepID=UPI0013CA2930|nr:HAD family hydrolase [Moorena sp. SIO3B2]NEP36663.1 haloacid dehalogenase-like hydrolase [Moorena sp. SIO3B2]